MFLCYQMITRRSSWCFKTFFAIPLDLFWTFSQAEACKSFSQALKKCPSGMYAEIKYDGERVQVLCKNIIQIDDQIMLRFKYRRLGA